jgi:hypothetical protein
MGGGIRTQIEQRLAIGIRHVPIHGLGSLDPGGSPGSLAMIRSALMTLANGGPFTRWFDDVALEAVLTEAPTFDTPTGLCRSLCDRARAGSKHVDRMDDDLEWLSGRLTIGAQERFGLALPHLSDSKPAYCRHFATTVSRAYSAVTASTERFTDTAVLFIMGLPQCGAEPGRLHAWNWLVDFERGTIAAFDPQSHAHGDRYANVSALLYTLAAAGIPYSNIPGLRLLVRRPDSVHGGTVLFHLARHPIDRPSRHKIASRLRATNFERVVPGWEHELAAWDALYRADGRGVSAGEIVRFASE